MSHTQELLIDIARRKERLAARAQAQRVAVAASVRELEQPIGIVDRGVEIVRFLRSHPLLVAVAAAAFTALRGRGLAGIAGRVFSAWRLWRTLAAWSAGRSL